MPSCFSSIVIPVHNRWDLTRICLRSLAKTLTGQQAEIIVVDNASDDVTPQACAPLGKNLFGTAFAYIRNELNRNFAGACNQGAILAKGERIVFLNNDTEAISGWHEALISDFGKFPGIAATGPLLLYPEDEIFGHTIQHLGVLVSPQSRFGHLYSGIPAASPLAAKRRFFQIITAACMMIPRALFLDIGGFDEAYVNGFEDVDLCARLTHAGYRMTVNPAAKMIHYESQTAGRKKHETENFKRASEKAAPFLRPDWHEHLHKDDLELSVTDDLFIKQVLPARIRARLDPLAEKTDAKALKKLLTDFPYWEKGLATLAHIERKPRLRFKLLERLFMLNKDPLYLVKQYELAKENGKKFEARRVAAKLRAFLDDLGDYNENIQYAQATCHTLGLEDLAHQYEAKKGTHAAHEARIANLGIICREMELATA